MAKTSNKHNRLVVTGAAIVLLWSTTAASEDQVVASGKFEGLSGHATSGTVTIKQTSEATIAVLESDFSFDGAPDPKVGFGHNGYDKSTTISALKSNKGTQTYEIPASIDVSKYTEFYLWCERHSVPLGVAPLEK
ncbi:MAG: DM13 domain-containing protein [Gammaproteobacteria bacterium]|nr:DM13 domain-containing protein [Gammaproteobacteria bacterium]